MATTPTDFNEQIIASLSSGVIAIDHEGAIITANQAAANHLGVTLAHLQPGGKIEGITALAKIKQEMTETQQPISRRELEIDSPDGTRIIGLTASPMQGAAAFNGAIFLFADLTKLRELERSATLNRQLAQIGELTAGVVHELRSPLSVVSGMSELLLRKLKEKDNYRKAELIHDEAVNMAKLISQFLSFSRPFELSLGACSASDVAERALRLCDDIAKERGVTVTASVDDDVPSMNIDHSLISLAVANLLRNAVEVSETGTRVQLSITANTDAVKFRVEDEGPGIDIAPTEVLFDAFFSKKEGGTGLGLSIVHRIITAHGGKINYGNRELVGAFFDVRLPLAIAP